MQLLLPLAVHCRAKATVRRDRRRKAFRNPSGGRFECGYPLSAFIHGHMRSTARTMRLQYTRKAAHVTVLGCSAELIHSCLFRYLFCYPTSRTQPLDSTLQVCCVRQVIQCKDVWRTCSLQGVKTSRKVCSLSPPSSTILISLFPREIFTQMAIKFGRYLLKSRSLSPVMHSG